MRNDITAKKCQKDIFRGVPRPSFFAPKPHRKASLRRFIFQMKTKKNSSSASVLNSYNFTILRSVFYSRNGCVSNRNRADSC